MAVCCGDHASGISDGSRTGSTSGGCTQHVFGLRQQPTSKDRRGCTEASRSSAWPDAHSFPRPRPFKLAGSSHDGMSRWCVLGCGADADRYGPRRFRWAGECVASGTSVSHRVSSSRPLAVQHFWDWSQGHEPVSASPVLRLRRFIPRTFTWVKTLRPPPGGFLVFWLRRVRGADAALCGGKDRRPIKA